MIALAVLAGMLLETQTQMDLAYLHSVAREVVESAKVLPGAEVGGGGRNTTGQTLRVPGGTQNYYPAFWIRDAAMMLGADLVPVKEVDGWIRVIAQADNGREELTFAHDLRVPEFSVPDHITLSGEACWYPGAYTNQGVGDFGYLPPADDAFYFVQMAWEYARLAKSARVMLEEIPTPQNSQPLIAICAEAYRSVAAYPDTGLVVCSDVLKQGRVDWGFCDSVTKTGSCLMPSLLRWEAANRLAHLYSQLGFIQQAKIFSADAKLIAQSIPHTFYRPLPDGAGMLLSATGIGKKDDVWASSFAIYLGVLPKGIERAVARHLADLVQRGGTVIDGQVRHIPPSGEFGGYWEQCKAGQGSYQNGGYWATPTGWLVAALRKVDSRLGDRILHEYVSYLRANRSIGAPFEWINPVKHTQTNANYGSSAGLVYAVLRESYHDRSVLPLR